MIPDHWNGCKRTFAGITLVLSLVLCGLAGRLPEGVNAMALPDGSTPQMRSAYLQELGWETENEQQDSVLLPPEFTGVYRDYLALQRECGFDLIQLAGKTVERYRYDILNYPTGENGVQLDLLVYEGSIVGGDVRTAELNGFMHSLKREGR